MAFKPIQLILCVTLVAALLVAPVSAAGDEEGGGILQAIMDFFLWWIPTPDDPDPDEGMDIPQAGVEIPGTNMTPPMIPPDPDADPEENITAAPRVLGTVFAVDYHTTPPYGSAPLMIRFTATDESDIEYTHWAFGDGASSTERDHWHSYMEAGIYTATLTAGNATWNETASIRIEVEPPGVVPLPEDEEMV